MPQWILHLPCTAEEALAINMSAPFADDEDPPVLTTDEQDGGSGTWLLTAYFARRPSPDQCATVVALAPSYTGRAPVADQLEPQDWVVLSQEGLRPIITGRFHVHSADFPPSPGLINLQISAAQAFGTGHHGTTLGCLKALENWAEDGAAPSNILDLGTGTGLLAFAAHKIWPQARILATDIDAVAINVAEENALLNDVRVGPEPGAVSFLTADGVDAAIRERAPYDLIIANILAEPLIALAPAIAPLLAADGKLLLSGLLTSQSAAVHAAYACAGLGCIAETLEDEWAILTLARASTR